MRNIISLIAALVCSIAAFAYSPAIKDVDISVQLHKDGSASINEKWNVTVASGTEWYLVRSNLGDIKISALSVSDETGKSFDNVGEWDIDKSLSQKAGRCGIVHKGSNGVELCWGVGAMGDHVFTVGYKMSNVVKSMEDYDAFHLQLLSPGLSASPHHVKVSIGADDIQLDTNTTRAWGFGYKGDVLFKDGKVILETTAPVKTDSYGSVIALIRFDKGMFASGSILNGPFSDKLDKALEGASFDDDRSDKESNDSTQVALVFMYMLGIIIIAIKALKNKIKRDKRKVLGVNPKEISWQRDIPFGGDLVASDYVLTRLCENRNNNALSSALILKMVYNGNLTVNKDAKGKIEFSFNNDSGLDAASLGLYGMMLKASGTDKILQDKEFSRWSSRHAQAVNNWVLSLKVKGANALRISKYMDGNTFLPDGQKQARDLVGLRMFLSDFTLMKEKSVIEAHLWKDYIAFGALFGIADLVAKQLKDIDPKQFEQSVNYDYTTLSSVLYQTRVLSRSITNARDIANFGSSSSRGGFGGGASFGGGGGFSGGGFGGGSR